MKNVNLPGQTMDPPADLPEKCQLIMFIYETNTEHIIQINFIYPLILILCYWIKGLSQHPNWIFRAKRAIFSLLLGIAKRKCLCVRACDHSSNQTHGFFYLLFHGMVINAWISINKILRKSCLVLKNSRSSSLMGKNRLNRFKMAVILKM